MSGLEAFGTTVNVAQLCSYINHSLASIRSTLEYLRDLPHTVQKRTAYLDSLNLIIDSIAHNPSLRTSAVEVHLRSVTADINSLRDILVKILQKTSGKRIKCFWKVYWSRSGLEEKITATFTSLEPTKAICSFTS